jgi:glycosyltransferase involved in cell wall biosynthesis
MKPTLCHLITSEYPPQAGGVSDYTRLVATGLAAAGDEVHVWCPSITKAFTGADETTGCVTVHREMGRIAPADLRRVGHLLDQFPAPRRLLVQWVPHGYGYRSMNLAFCAWLWRRSTRQRDQVELMVHEPYLPFNGSLRRNGVALMHRLMTIMLLQAARRVWISIPAWESYCRPYTLGRRLSFDWLPVASNIPVVEDAKAVQTIRARYRPADGLIIGHFGAYDRHVTELLLDCGPSLLQQRPGESMLFIGRGSEFMRDSMAQRHPELTRRVHATGDLSPVDLSLHLSACDLLLQPFIDGVSSRRTSIMVALAHGLPIVTTSGELTEDLWTEEGAVSLAPAKDPSAIVNETQRLLADADARRRLGRAARALYEERFDVRHIIAALQKQERDPRRQAQRHEEQLSISSIARTT